MNSHATMSNQTEHHHPKSAKGVDQGNMEPVMEQGAEGGSQMQHCGGAGGANKDACAEDRGEEGMTTLQMEDG